MLGQLLAGCLKEAETAGGAGDKGGAIAYYKKGGAGDKG